MNGLPLLLGFVGVPALLLVTSHRFRHRTPWVRRQFWWGVSGWVVGMIVAIAVMIGPPTAWTGEQLRTFVVYWGPLVGFITGSGIALLRSLGSGSYSPLED